VGSRFGGVSKLCERPGCSEPGAAAYGMVPEDLLFWIAPLGDAPTPDPSVLCKRHADAMVVPRGWTLDDRREAQPRLFKPRPTAATATTQPTSRRRRSHHAGEGEQLVIDGTGEIPRPVVDSAHAPATDGADTDVPDDTDTDTDTGTDAAAEPVAPWQPDFDHDDDLGGLLEVSSPLLARAFRGTGRRRA
jgi:hypothetical protein